VKSTIRKEAIVMADSFLVRLSKGMDLLEAIAAEFRKRSISKAAFSLVGAVESAVVGFYDLKAKEYRNRTFEGDYEISACIGNVSLKDGEIFVHAHITLSGEDYVAFGGHLMPGTVIFAAELYGNPVPGDPPARQFDEATGLYLWGGTLSEPRGQDS
jgi:hypothetical protein